MCVCVCVCVCAYCACVRERLKAENKEPSVLHELDEEDIRLKFLLVAAWITPCQNIEPEVHRLYLRYHFPLDSSLKWYEHWDAHIDWYWNMLETLSNIPHTHTHTHTHTHCCLNANKPIQSTVFLVLLVSKLMHELSCHHWTGVGHSKCELIWIWRFHINNTLHHTNRIQINVCIYMYAHSRHLILIMTYYFFLFSFQCNGHLFKCFSDAVLKPRLKTDDQYSIKLS